MSVVGCTDLSDSKDRQVGVGTVVTSDQSLHGPTVSILARNARDVGLIPILSTIFPIFITPTTVLHDYRDLM